MPSIVTAAVSQAKPRPSPVSQSVSHMTLRLFENLDVKQDERQMCSISVCSAQYVDTGPDWCSFDVETPY